MECRGRHNNVVILKFRDLTLQGLNFKIQKIAPLWSRVGQIHVLFIPLYLNWFCHQFHCVIENIVL